MTEFNGEFKINELHIHKNGSNSDNANKHDCENCETAKKLKEKQLHIDKCHAYIAKQERLLIEMEKMMTKKSKSVLGIIEDLFKNSCE